MTPQNISVSDLPQVLVLVFLEILLSADNAVVLGILSHSLPEKLRRKALFIGLVSSFILRAAALLVVSLLLKNRWLQILGAAYLMFLSIRHFWKSGKPLEVKPAQSFWKTVVLIELMDLVFALDSIVAGVAFIDSDFSKLWIVYTGGIIGLIGMRYAASLFSSLLDRFPTIEVSAYLLVGWIGIKLFLGAIEYPLPPFIFWGVTGLFFLLGFFRPKR